MREDQFAFLWTTLFVAVISLIPICGFGAYVLYVPMCIKPLIEILDNGKPGEKALTMVVIVVLAIGAGIHLAVSAPLFWRLTTGNY